jgi:hypothetical protein
MTINDQCSFARKALLAIQKDVRDLMAHHSFNVPSESPDMVHADLAEMRANIMLAVRHIEDARMRMGKVIQAANGGISVYDKQGD